MTTAEQISIKEELEHSILHGLACEWKAALWVLDDEHKRMMKKPLFCLKNMRRRLAYWSGSKKEICLSRKLVYHFTWDTVRDVLFHEMAHQLAETVLGADKESPHGPLFQKACRLLRANPKAAEIYPASNRLSGHTAIAPKDKIMLLVKKLMALAESKNRYEAEAAMLKAHELIKKFHLKRISEEPDREFISIFLGKPALRHFREAYHLAHLIQDFYFVEGIWVSAYVMDKRKMGRVLEISGTPQNIKLAHYVYDFVNHYINAQWRQYNRKNNLNRYRKIDFAVGIIEGFRSKLLQHNQKQVENDAKHALITTDDPLLKQYMAYKYPHTVSFRRSASNHDETIYRDGKRIGKQMVIHKGIAEKGENQRRLLE